MLMPLMGFVALSGAIALTDHNVDQQSNLLQQPIKPNTVVHSLESGKAAKTSGIVKDLSTPISSEKKTGQNTLPKQKPIVKSAAISASDPSVIRQKHTKTSTIKNVLSEPKPSPKMFLIGNDARNEPESSWMK